MIHPLYPEDFSMLIREALLYVPIPHQPKQA
jgi:hypothetical protein